MTHAARTRLLSLKNFRSNVVLCTFLANISKLKVSVESLSKTSICGLGRSPAQPSPAQPSPAQPSPVSDAVLLGSGPRQDGGGGGREVFVLNTDHDHGLTNLCLPHFTYNTDHGLPLHNRKYWKICILY